MAELPASFAALRLMTWLSPAFPVGGFSYSHGLEAAVEAGWVSDRQGLQDWLAALVEFGSGWNDAVLLAESWRVAVGGGDFAGVAELAEALAGSRERHLESMMQGEGFLAAASNWPHPTIERLGRVAAYCVAVGTVSGAHGVALEAALGAFLQAFCANLAQVAVRLSITGQKGAMQTVAELEPLVLRTARRASATTLDDLGSATVLSDIAAARHEVQYSRLFRS